ncbi:MAG: hypothetical protein V7632_1870 [Bradyrhizobium sp.]|jgi:hypothetical protein
MSQPETTYDHHRYRRLLSEATDETSRLLLIDLLIREKARDRLEAQRASDRDAMTAETVAKVLGSRVPVIKILSNVRREHLRSQN